MDSIGERLKSLRAQTGLSGQQVSKILGLSINAYYSYERNFSTPSCERYIKLAELYHTTVQYIITGKELSADVWSKETTPFPERLRELRVQSGLTQKAVAKVLEINFSSYQQYEYAINEPKLDKLLKLAELFDVTLDELMGRNRK